MSIAQFPESELLQEAEIYARVIVAWHHEIGLQMAPGRMVNDGEPRQDSLDEYRRVVSHFLNSDLRSKEVQAELANVQLSGMFEWFYHEVIPESVWGRFADQSLRQPPQRLYEAARHIRQLHERLSAVTQAVEDPVPEPQENNRGNSVQFSSRRELEDLARAYYAPYIQEERVGIGGANFLLSSSLERSANRSPDTGEITLLTLDYLGFESVREFGKDHLLTRLRAGEIHIESVEGF